MPQSTNCFLQLSSICGMHVYMSAWCLLWARACVGLVPDMPSHHAVVVLSGRGGESVSETILTEKPSEAEQALRALLQQMRSSFPAAAAAAHFDAADPSASLSMAATGSTSAARAAGVIAAGKAHLESLELQRTRLFPGANALSLAQRSYLYKLDELEMALLRMVRRAPGEHVTAQQMVRCS